MDRDKHGFIGQTEPGISIEKYFDMGDAAFSCGMMAFAGSWKDFYMMPLFIKDNKLVRHPYDLRWNDSMLTSRDQVIAFFSGMHEARNSFVVQQACLSYANSWFVNKDILLPHVRSYLYALACEKPPLWIEKISPLFMFFSIMFDCYVKPNHEMNQSVCIATVNGKSWLRLLNKHHPDIFGNLKEYFCGWRDKKEIFDALSEFLKNELE